MSDMKCPFCGQAIMCMDAQDADEHSTWYCPRCIAEKAWYAFGNKTLWQELIRTRKALDVALCSLQNIAESDGDFITGASTPLDEHEYADMMLKEIKRQMKIKTALEQKDK